MKRELSMDFTSITEVPQREGRGYKQVRDPVQTMQMSVRMKPDVYERFQQHARLDRRTNGEMLEIMMEAYERELKRPD